MKGGLLTYLVFLSKLSTFLNKKKSYVFFLFSITQNIWDKIFSFLTLFLDNIFFDFENLIFIPF